MREGYIYCLGNKSMPGIYKIGMTERTPKERLSEANRSDTFKPPTPYTIEFAKCVLDPKNKEYTIHNILKNTRINFGREFFSESLEKIKLIFDSIDGEYWQSNIQQPHISVVTKSASLTEKRNKIEDTSDSYENGEISSKIIKGCRVMSLCFSHNQRIRHRIRKNKHDESIWVSVYNATEDGILFQGRVLTLNQFASRHYATEVPNRTSRVNAWLECECEVNGSWISTYDLDTIRH